jgi:hypothetical protein
MVNEGIYPPSPLSTPKLKLFGNPRQLKRIYVVFNWITSVNASIPIQLLCNKVVKRDPDSLPAVLTTEKLLASLLPEYNKYYSLNKIKQRIEKGKMQSNKKTRRFKKKTK